MDALPQEEAEVVRLIALATEIQLIGDSAVGLGAFFDIDDCEEIIVLAVGVDAEDIEVLLRPIEAFDEGRQAGLRLGGVGQEHGAKQSRQGAARQ